VKTLQNIFHSLLVFHTNQRAELLTTALGICRGWSVQSRANQRYDAITGQTFKAGCAVALSKTLDSVILIEMERSY